MENAWPCNIAQKNFQSLSIRQGKSLALDSKTLAVCHPDGQFATGRSGRQKLKPTQYFGLIEVFFAYFDEIIKKQIIY